jgi:hypothetical protein
MLLIAGTIRSDTMVSAFDAGNRLDCVDVCPFREDLTIPALALLELALMVTSSSIA